jgi:hypothetical protein
VTPPRRPLAGYIINLSLSESDDSLRRGFPFWQVNRVTLQIVAALFGQGASIVFGHDWREDGVMEAVYGFARQVQPPIPRSDTAAAAEEQPLLRNLLPWPDSPYLSNRDLERLRSTLRVESAGLPPELLPFDAEARRAEPDSALYRFMRARGLTSLRHRLNAVCHVRLCIGGRRSGSAGRYPGVIEEALLGVRANKPLFLAGFLGGATEQVADAIEGKEIPDDFCEPTPIQGLYADPPVREFSSATSKDRIIDRTAIWMEFAAIGRSGGLAANGLTIAENSELVRTPVIDRVIELVLIGLSRLGTDFELRV